MLDVTAWNGESPATVTTVETRSLWSQLKLQAAEDRFLDQYYSDANLDHLTEIMLEDAIAKVRQRPNRFDVDSEDNAAQVSEQSELVAV